MIDISTGKPMTRRSALTGLAGILAAGVAPAAVVRSMLGARGVATSGKALPYDAEVEYLDTNATSFIDTGIMYDPTKTMIFGATMRFVTDPMKFAYAMGWIGGGAVGRGGVYVGNGWTNGTTGNECGGNVLTKTNLTVIINIGASSNSVISADPGKSSERGHTSISSYATAGYRFGRALNSDNDIGNVRIWSAFAIVNRVRVFDAITVRVGNEGFMYDRANPKGGPLGNGLYGNAGTGYFDFPGRVS